MKRRAAFYQQLDDTRTFRSSLSHFDVSSLSTHTAGLPKDTGGLQQAALGLSEQLHEQIHWLQHIGTSTGLLALALDEFQNSISAQLMVQRGSDMRVDDLPLLDRDEHRRELPMWMELESLYYLVFGGALEQARGGHLLDCTFALRTVSRLCASMSKRLAGSSPDLIALLEEWWEAWHIRETTPKKGCIVIASGDSAIAAAAMMEGAARINQFAIYEETAGIGQDIPLERHSWFRGIYGEVHDLFHRRLDVRRTPRSEIVCATLIDCALNAPLPPVVALHEIESHQMHMAMPIELFLRLIEAIRGFDTNSRIVVSQESVRGLITDVYAHLKDRGYRQLPLDIMQGVEFAFAGVRELGLPDAVYTLDQTTNHPVGRNTGMFAFIGKRALQVVELRRHAPEAVVMPACILGSQRRTWMPLYKEIQPPLLGVNEHHLESSTNDEAWYVTFLERAVQHDLLRYMVLSDLEGVVRRIRRFRRVRKNEDLVTHCVDHSIYSVLGRGQLATAILEGYHA